MLYNIVPKYYGLFRHQHYHPGVGEIIGIEIGTKKAPPPDTFISESIHKQSLYMYIHIYLCNYIHSNNHNIHSNIMNADKLIWD